MVLEYRSNYLMKRESKDQWIFQTTLDNVTFSLENFFLETNFLLREPTLLFCTTQRENDHSNLSFAKRKSFVHSRLQKTNNNKEPENGKFSLQSQNNCN